ncbi:hypothetical protein B5X24_HaOG212622 [Helicoverpa armigera]|nr:hypothetical protein B5X24_HaOG212622 [Helicoverpa armigera]
MTKMGKSFESHHQPCLVHGIQLAVIDVMYKYKFQQTFSSVPLLNPHIETLQTDSEGDTSDHQGGDDALNYVEAQLLETERPEFIYKNLIDKVRKIVKLSRKAPTNNDLLKKICD